MVDRSFIAFDNEVLREVNTDGSLGDPIVNNSDTPDGTIFEFQSGFSAQTITLNDAAPSDPDVFDDDQSTLHTINPGQGGGIVADNTQVESESRIDLQALDVNGDPTGPVISVYVFSQGGVFSNVWGVGLTEPLTPGVRYIKVAGSNNGDSDYTDFVPCFVAGTRVRTGGGTARVEDMRVGDLVWTPKGLRSVEWVGTVTTDGSGKMAPVEIATGVLGNTRPLRVSPQHRMVVTGWQTELLFGTTDVLVPALHLVGRAGVRRCPTKTVTYVHFLCDGHAIVEAEGALTESFYPGDMALAALAPETRAELLHLFPELAKDRKPVMALPGLHGHEAKVLAAALA